MRLQAKNKILSETPVEKNTPDEPLPEMKNPRLVVKKSDRKLEVFDGEKLVKTYRVGLGFAPVGDKEKQGDGKTPEGEFYIFTKNDQSRFYLSIGVSYPSTEDAERGLREKLISKRPARRNCRSDQKQKNASPKYEARRRDLHSRQWQYERLDFRLCRARRRGNEGTFRRDSDWHKR